MAMKYWQTKVKGERAAEELQNAIGQAGGMIVRLHFEAGETHVYFASEKSAAAKVSKAIKGARTPREVRAIDVKKIA